MENEGGNGASEPYPERRTEFLGADIIYTNTVSYTATLRMP